MGRLRGGTVRRRFTILYAMGFLGSGIVLLALTYLMSGTRVTALARTRIRNRPRRARPTSPPPSSRSGIWGGNSRTCTRSRTTGCWSAR
ncbi:hypothetical protein WKI68_07625 [Streptomyces sp. MS1.HAVA.3]|uniref:Uncharacterized protein n=1 Tax=Streptomyces caledonius TaxID=3134107 RepID=A0ABU8U0H8_9ACTN